jgi:hypothetical protein
MKAKAMGVKKGGNDVNRDYKQQYGALLDEDERDMKV